MKTREERFIFDAFIEIAGFEGFAKLKDVSFNGFCFESSTYVSLEVGKSYSITIKPENVKTVKGLKFSAKVKWFKTTGSNFKAGFKIEGNRNLLSDLNSLKVTEKRI
jgi:hypothetical protein